MAAGDVVARHDPPVAPRCGRRTRARAGTSGCGASGRHDLLLERPRPAVALRDGPRRFDGQAGRPDAAEREAADTVTRREVARVRRRLARQGADERLRRADRPPGRHWPPDARRHRRVRARSRMVAGREGGQLLPPGGGRLATLVDLGRPAGRGRRQEARARPVRPVVARRPTARPRRADRRLRRGSIRPRPLRTRTCRLTATPELEQPAGWSPDGRYVLFTRFRSDGRGANVFVVGGDGSSERRLTQGTAEDVAAAWSPDGRLILFTSDRGGREQVYVMRSDGQGLRNLSHGRFADTATSWR